MCGCLARISKEMHMKRDVSVCPVQASYIGIQGWCGGLANSYPGEVLGSTPQTWLNGLACSHVLHLTLSGAPKILLYCTEYRRPMTLAPMNEESWAQWGINLIGKNNLCWVKWSVHVVSLDTNNQAVETCQEKYFTLWLFVYVNSFFRFNPQTVFTLWTYMYIRLICSALNPWLFIRIWMTSFLSRVWKDT